MGQIIGKDVGKILVLLHNGEKMDTDLSEIFLQQTLGKPSNKKNGKKRGHCPHVGEGGQSQFINLAQNYRNLPRSQITQKLTPDTLEIQLFVTFLSFLGHF